MRKYLVLALSFITLGTVSQAQQFAPSASATTPVTQFEVTAPKQFPGIKIENFGQMDERFFRGSQPTAEDYKSLKEFGITTVIDLRKDNEEYSKATVESLGMKYVHVPMSGWTTRDESVAEFLKAINDPANGKVYVHCAAGKHRTGLVGAIYRLEKYGWDYDTAYKEMKNYEYFSGLFHRKIKAYVKDYYERFGTQRQAAVRAASAIPQTAASNVN